MHVCLQRSSWQAIRRTVTLAAVCNKLASSDNVTVRSYVLQTASFTRCLSTAAANNDQRPVRGRINKRDEIVELCKQFALQLFDLPAHCTWRTVIKYTCMGCQLPNTTTLQSLQRRVQNGSPPHCPSCIVRANTQKLVSATDLQQYLLQHGMKLCNSEQNNFIRHVVQQQCMQCEEHSTITYTGLKQRKPGSTYCQRCASANSRRQYITAAELRTLLLQHGYNLLDDSDKQQYYTTERYTAQCMGCNTTSMNTYNHLKQRKGDGAGCQKCILIAANAILIPASELQDELALRDMTLINETAQQYYQTCEPYKYRCNGCSTDRISTTGYARLRLRPTGSLHCTYCVSGSKGYLQLHEQAKSMAVVPSSTNRKIAVPMPCVHAARCCDRLHFWPHDIPKHLQQSCKYHTDADAIPSYAEMKGRIEQHKLEVERGIVRYDPDRNTLVRVEVPSAEHINADTKRAGD